MRTPLAQKKSGIRILGIDDGPFDRLSHHNVLVVGVIYRGAHHFDGLLSTTIRKDGRNATSKLIQMLTTSKFHGQIHVIVLDGIALGGFNVIDLTRLHTTTDIPVMTVIRRQPDFNAIYAALAKLPGGQSKTRLIKRAGPIITINNLYCQLHGLSEDEARHVIELTCTNSNIPEPLRVAHLIAGGIVTGQSGHAA